MLQMRIFWLLDLEGATVSKIEIMIKYNNKVGASYLVISTTNKTVPNDGWEGNDSVYFRLVKIISTPFWKLLMITCIQQIDFTF